MRRQKSTYTMRSPESSFSRQNFEPQAWMPTLSEVSNDWISSDNFLDNKEQMNAIMSFENPMINPETLNYNNNYLPWNQFYYPQDYIKPEIMATPSEIFDGFSEVSLPVDFSDIGSVVDELEQSQEPFPQVNYWQEPVDICPAETQNSILASFPEEQSYVLPAEHIQPNCIDTRNAILQYNWSPRLYATSYRSVSIMLRHLVSVDISPEGAIYVHNIPGQNIAVVSDSGDRVCIIHPNSRILQERQNVHIMTHQARLVKISSRGIAFTTTPGSIVYLVDESGTKSTSGKFVELSKDYTSEVFYGPYAKDFAMRSSDCLKMLSDSSHQPQRNGDDIWTVGNVQIKQDQYGNIEVSRDMGSILVTVLPTAGEVSVQTPSLNVTVGCFSKRYLSVQKNNCRVTSGFCGLTVQKGTQKAGLDRGGKVCIF